MDKRFFIVQASHPYHLHSDLLPDSQTVTILFGSRSAAEKKASDLATRNKEPYAVLQAISVIRPPPPIIEELNNTS